MTAKRLRSHRIPLTAGADFPLDIDGDVYSVVASTSTFTITFDESNRFTEQSAGQGARFSGPYKRVVLNSAVTQVVTVIFGYGVVTDARASVNAVLNTTIAPSDTVNNPGDVTAGATPTLAVAANADRKEVELCLPSDAANPVRIGNASVTSTSGSILEPGMSKVFACEAALYVIRTVTDETVTVLELERP